MEKILVKKEFYKERYKFMNFMEFSRFCFDFFRHFPNFLDLAPLKKGENRGEKIIGSWPT